MITDKEANYEEQIHHLHDLRFILEHFTLMMKQLFKDQKFRTYNQDRQKKIIAFATQLYTNQLDQNFKYNIIQPDLNAEWHAVQRQIHAIAHELIKVSNIKTNNRTHFSDSDIQKYENRDNKRTEFNQAVTQYFKENFDQIDTLPCLKGLSYHQKIAITQHSLEEVQSYMNLQYIHEIAPAIEHRFLQILIHIQPSAWHDNNGLDTLIEESIKHYRTDLQEQDIESLKQSTREKTPIKTKQTLFKYAQQNFLHHEQSMPTHQQTFQSDININDLTSIAVSFWETLKTKIKSNIDCQISSEKERDFTVSNKPPK